MLTYGIFLFFSIFPIIHPKGLAQMPEGNMENTELLPLGVEQKNDEAEHPGRKLGISSCGTAQAVVEKHSP